jgi:hypothetical protein
MNNGDMTAAPMANFNQDEVISKEQAKDIIDVFGGLTKREYFAGLALNLFRERIGDVHSAQIATQCVEMADALLKELEK